MVIDGSVLVAALVDSGADGRWAESMIVADELAGPELALVETSNILRRLERAGRVSQFKAASDRAIRRPRPRAAC